MPTLPPVDAVAVTRAVVTPASPWREIQCVAETGSTNADVAQAAHAGAAAGLVRIAEHQTAGRGRFQRVWSEVPGSGIAMSVLLQPAQPLERWGWLPLVLGLAVRDGLAEATGAPVQLKWPNDVLLDSGPRPGKLCGLLSEAVQTPTGLACVLGMGINVGMAADELPVPTATSLLLAGVTTDKTVVVTQVLRALEAWFARFETGEDLTAAYVAQCSTVGRRVRVQLDAELGRGDALVGAAVGVDAAGSLLVRDDAGVEHAMTAGDAVHVR